MFVDADGNFFPYKCKLCGFYCKSEKLYDDHLNNACLKCHTQRVNKICPKCKI